MVISVKHKFTSAKADGGDASLVQPSNWNDTHDITLAASSLLGRAAGTAGAAQEVTLGAGLSFSGTTLLANPMPQVATDVAAATVKATPVDADSLLLSDSAASNAPKKLTWANLKATLKTYLDTLYEVKNAAILKSNAAAALAVGYVSTLYYAGSISSGTVTPTFANRNVQYYANNGAHTLAAAALSNEGGTMIVRINNTATAGAVTLSGWTMVTGDTLTTTNGHMFMLYITMVDGSRHLHIQALQ